MHRILDADVARLYARALVAVARADDEINVDEGHRLEAQIVARVPVPIPLEDLLLVEPLEHEALGEAIRTQAGPFRGGDIDPRELARMFVGDAVAVVLAKGYVAESEAHQIMRFATVLGCSVDEICAMSGYLAPWGTSFR
jgi:uncharacterized tellurite resistance protein B-like protein